jgi:hypothetical protein
MTAEATLDAIAPELASAANKSIHIDLAEAQTGDVYGDRREYAVALLAAHSLTIAKRAGQGGAVSSLQEDSLSISYGDAQGSIGLSATSYGVELQRLRRQYIMAARTRLV